MPPIYWSTFIQYSASSATVGVSARGAVKRARQAVRRHLQKSRQIDRQRVADTAGAAALALTLALSGAVLAQEGEPTTPVENPNTGEVSDTLIPQANAYETYAEHIRVLNECDWVGLMAQYPEDAEIHLAGGTVVKGRQAIGDLFAAMGG